jgi:3-hydroxyacyl-[acyl-carrier-protein] dehydratase
MIEKAEILKLIPHRPPFLWIDRVEHIEPGARCIAVKLVDPAEPCFAGHFPGDAILPGVLIIEAAAQTAGVMLASMAAGPEGERRLAAVNRFKFLEPVRPGAEMRIETKTLASLGPMTSVEATVSVAGRVVARGDLSVYAG